MANDQLAELFFVIGGGQVGHQFCAVDEEFQLLNQVSHRVDKLVVVRLRHQVVNGEATADDVHEQFVEFSRDFEQSLVVCLAEWLQLLRLLVEHHFALLLVEEEPNAHDAFQVVLAHLLEVGLGTLQLFLALFFQHFEVKAQESLHSRRIIDLKVLHVVVQRVQRLDQPLVHLRPRHREVILDEDGDHKRQLFVAAPREYHIVRVVDHLQQLGLDLISQLIG